MAHAIALKLEADFERTISACRLTPGELALSEAFLPHTLPSALRRELLRAVDDNQDINFDTDTIEIDSDGSVYRVWQGTNLVGSFHRSPVDSKWLADPVYGRDYERYDTPESAQKAIVDAWTQAQTSLALPHPSTSD